MTMRWLEERGLSQEQWGEDKTYLSDKLMTTIQCL